MTTSTVTESTAETSTTATADAASRHSSRQAPGPRNVGSYWFLPVVTSVVFAFSVSEGQELDEL
ncbi:hypothetical protein ABZ746_25345 [Streptomyces sp. NPDC020096]